MKIYLKKFLLVQVTLIFALALVALAMGTVTANAAPSDLFASNAWVGGTIHKFAADGTQSTLATGLNAPLEPGVCSSWTPTGGLNTVRIDHTGTLLPNGMVLVAGGSAGGKFLASAELYDPTSGTWADTGSLNTGRSAHMATLLPNGMVLVAGGFGAG